MTPLLPPLYFDGKDASVSTLPAELLHSCLVSYGSWGTLAKVSGVQHAWKTTLYDASHQNDESLWNYCQARLQGHSGLRPGLPHTELAHLAQNFSDSPHAAPAMRLLGIMNLQELNQPETGIEWLEKAYTSGDLDAAYELATIYEHGRYGIAVDVVKAAEWLECAAKQGHVEAMAELGLCYELGCGVQVDDEQSLDWYVKAAEKGHVTAKFSVGEIFEQARGVPQSDAEACRWYYRAALAGDEDSKVALLRLLSIARIVVPGVRNILNV